MNNSEKFLFCVGKEIGEEGTPHLQGVVMSRDKKYKWRPIPMFSVKRDGKNVGHWSKMKKCFEANYNYCSKDGDYVSNYVKDDNKVSVPDWGTLYYCAKSGHCGGPREGVEWITLWHKSLPDSGDKDTNKLMSKWLYELYKANMISDWDI